MKIHGEQYGSFRWRLVWCLSLFVLLSPVHAEAQQDPEYEEISVYLMVQRVGGIEIPAVYHNHEIYLPVPEIFNFLQIKNIPSPLFDSVAGYFISQESPYVVDKVHSRIVYSGKVYDLKTDDILRTETSLYLRSVFFGEVFGLDCTFDFRSLSVTLNTKIELPVIRDMRLEFMRSNINRMKGEAVADTIIPRSRPLFRFGTADWSVVSNQEIGGETQARFNLGLGSTILGGEARVALQYFANEPFTEKQQQYFWRLVNNDRKALRQVVLGKISPQATSSIYNPVLGLQFTNAPTTYRRSFGTWTLTDYTEPDWSVELYVNNVLVDYVKADASGFFKFEVPLMYGSTNVLLRFYGPYGEEKSREQSISIPYNFLPAREFQYSVSGGVVEDSLNSIFSRANANYGLSRFMSVGAGMEYLSSVTSGAYMPFASTSLRLGSNLLLYGEYTHGVRGKGILNYRTKRNFQVELNYTLYDANQTAINFNYLEERRAMVSFPVRGRKFSAFSRLAVSQNIMPATQYSTAEWLLSGVLFGVSTNFTTYAMFPQRADPFVYSNLSLGLRLPGKLVLRPQAQYDYTGNQFMLVKGELEKQFLKHGFMNVTYEYSFRTSVQSVQFGFRYDFSGVQTHVAYRSSNTVSTFYESARGSLLFDPKTKYVRASNRTSVGRGGIVILPFLDMNANGRYDKGESKVLGLRININGGRVEQSMRDSVIRIFDLEPYVGYFIELDKYSFDNIAWQMDLKSMNVTVDPNQFKLVEIPVSVMGEASGMVTLRSPSGDKGLGRIIVNFYRSSGAFFAKTLSEPDGYFSLLAFTPGSYVARIDTAQLRRLNMTASPATLTFEMERSVDGDFEDGLEFVISMNEKEEVVKDLGKVPEKALEQVPEKEIKTEVVKADKVDDAVERAVPENESVIYVIQVAASKTYLEPAYIRNKFELADSVLYFEKDGWYKYVTGRFNSDEEAWSGAARLRINGFVTSVKASDLKSGMKTAAVPPLSGTVYCVQIAAFKTYQDPAKLKNQYNLTEDVLYFQKDGWYKYVIGQYPTQQGAEARLAQSGISGFVTKIDRSLLKGK